MVCVLGLPVIPQPEVDERCDHPTDSNLDPIDSMAGALQMLSKRRRRDGDGTGIGCPVAPIMANVFMAHHGSSLMSELERIRVRDGGRNRIEPIFFFYAAESNQVRRAGDGIESKFQILFLFSNFLCMLFLPISSDICKILLYHQPSVTA